MIDLILIYPKFNKPTFAEPVGICFLSSYLKKKGYKIKIDDSFLYGFSKEKVADRVIKDNPVFVGISINSRPEFIESKSFVKILRKKGYKGNILLGGHAISLNANNFYIECGKLIDAIILGEGEKIIENILYSYKKNKSWKKIKGLLVRDRSGNLKNTGKGEIIENVNNIPFMDREILNKLIKKNKNSPINATILNNRGCYGSCKFCSIKQLSNLQGIRCFRERSMKNLVLEIKNIVENYNITDFYFCSPTFLSNKSKGENQTRELLYYLKKYNLKITFFAYLRTDGINKTIINNLKKAGLRTLFLGIESFNDNVLKFLNKNISSKENLEVMDLLLDEGFNCQYNAKYRLKIGYITFVPITTITDLRQQIKYFKKYKIPAKKLTCIYEIHNEKDLKKQEIDSKIIKININNKNVLTIYNYYCKYFKEAIKNIEVIRSIQKSSFIIKSNLNKELNKLLDLINIISYEYFNKLLYLSSKNDMELLCEKNINKIKTEIMKNKSFSILKKQLDENKNTEMYYYRLDRALHNPQLE